MLMGIAATPLLLSAHSGQCSNMEVYGIQSPSYLVDVSDLLPAPAPAAANATAATPVSAVTTAASPAASAPAFAATVVNAAPNFAAKC